MRFPAALLCLLSLPVCGAVAQTASDPALVIKLTDRPLPKDPAAALDILRKTNGLGEDTKPWHVHATYQTFDEQGKPSGTGTFEMWWASPTKYKQVFDSPSFKQTEYGTEKGVFRAGYNYPVPYPESFLLKELVHPLPSATTLPAKLDFRDLALGAVKLKCVMASEHLSYDAFPPLGLFPTYCYDPQKPLLQLSVEDTTTRIIRNKFVLFRDEYLAKQIDIFEKSSAIMHITVDEVESLPQIVVDVFAPTATADPAKPLTVLGPKMNRLKGLTGGQIIQAVDPKFPVEKGGQKPTEGLVRLKGIVTRDGHLRDISVVAAPDSAFAISAIQAVTTYKLQPFTLNSEAVEVELNIDVNFKR